MQSHRLECVTQTPAPHHAARGFGRAFAETCTTSPHPLWFCCVCDLVLPSVREGGREAQGRRERGQGGRGKESSIVSPAPLSRS